METLNSKDLEILNSKDYTIEDIKFISGRGMVFVAKAPKEISYYKNKVIEYGYKRYRICDIEYSLKPMYPISRDTNKPVGFVVKEI